MHISAVEEYRKANRLARKIYQSQLKNGEGVYLPFLDGILKNESIISEVSLGLVDIPVKKIVGTKSHSRGISFAANFMPLLKEGTEFASKWAALCNAHYKEGIRDPITVLEYLNRFYVVEGNKRASVLKYFEAISFPAFVTRLIPKRNEKDLTNRIYYEFMKFYDYTGINYIWFSEEKGFSELYKYLEKHNNQWNTMETENRFKQIYYRFRKLYYELGGEDLSITTGDALLEFIKIYGIWDNISDKEFKRRIKNVWVELESLSDEESIQLLTEPEGTDKKGLITSFTSLSTRKKNLKVAFVYAKTIEDSGWTYAHELGRLHVENVFKDQIETTYIQNVPEDETAYTYIKELAEKEYDAIFTTIPTHINQTLKAALEYPDTKFLNCSENMSYQQLKTYFGRIYEPKFLVGMIAGSMTKTNILGYVASYPIPNIINSVNAFALGARMVNPRVKIKVLWSNEWDNKMDAEEISLQLLHEGADIISHQDTMVPHESTKEFGLYSVIDMGQQRRKLSRDYLAVPIWHWGIFYEKLIQDIFSGSWITGPSLFSNHKGAINYWWGLDAGVVDIMYSNTLIPTETKKLVEFMKKMLIHGEFHPFTGPIHDQSGNLKVETDHVLSNEEILSMDWFVEYVDGEIPNWGEKSCILHPLVNMFGVKKTK